VKLAEYCGLPWLRCVLNALDMPRLNLKGFNMNLRLVPKGDAQ